MIQILGILGLVTFANVSQKGHMCDEQNGTFRNVNRGSVLLHTVNKIFLQKKLSQNFYSEKIRVYSISNLVCRVKMKVDKTRKIV